MGMGFAMAQKLSETLDSPRENRATQTVTPPPIPGEKQYYVAVGGHQTGPYTTTEMVEKMQIGEVTRESLVWRQGIGDWTPADSLDELRDKFATLPPPLPGE